MFVFTRTRNCALSLLRSSSSSCSKFAGASSTPPHCGIFRALEGPFNVIDPARLTCPGIFGPFFTITARSRQTLTTLKLQISLKNNT
jgi:hypothetical protein